MFISLQLELCNVISAVKILQYIYVVSFLALTIDIARVSHLITFSNKYIYKNPQCLVNTFLLCNAVFVQRGRTYCFANRRFGITLTSN